MASYFFLSPLPLLSSKLPSSAGGILFTGVPCNNYRRLIEGGEDVVEI
jgi:hypothetical protein